MDTPETVVQAIEHNAVYQAICPARPCIIDMNKVNEFIRENLDN
jgi:hypothetical protein